MNDKLAIDALVSIEKTLGILLKILNLLLASQVKNNSMLREIRNKLLPDLDDMENNHLKNLQEEHERHGVA